ncbi:hypothetical protein AB0L70_10905 [Kribbella sp. NPDC051952]|uniref:hypothetical protein n=1 Tax=Kribbella sp. NPDC051952 TaxID=3154851 RepID=UPI0034388E34
MTSDRLIARDSAIYQEVARLYRIAQSLRPTGIDRWNGDVLATTADIWGAMHPKSGVLRLSEARVLAHLGGSSGSTSSQRAQALATILHEATHGGMLVDAPNRPNAVRTIHSAGLTEGIAELRTFADFEFFAERASYGDLVLEKPQYPGVFVATESLIAHVTGPGFTRAALIQEATRGPVVMHFDQFAEAAVANHLPGMVPNRVADQLAVRAALIRPMVHPHWQGFQSMPAGIGESLAREVRIRLDITLEEIRRHYRVRGGVPFAEGAGGREVSREGSGGRKAGVDSLRFLGGQAPAAEAVVRRSELGGRGARVRSVRGPGHGAGPPNRGGVIDRRVWGRED